jgi:tetratricopeptide (TPR) repeat protein
MNGVYSQPERPGRRSGVRLEIAVILLLLPVLAAPVPAPSAEAEARGLMESAIALQAAGRGAEAVSQLSQAIDSGGLSSADTARATFDRGVAYDGLGNIAAAITDYSAAVRIDAMLAPAYNNRANAYRRLGKIKEARRDYQAALGCPGAAREYSYYGLGLIAQSEGDREAARGFFKKALEANPAYSPASQGLHALPPPPAIPDPPPKPKPGALVQLGAFQTETQALKAWETMAAASAVVLHDLKPVTVAVNLPGKGRFWRLRTSVADKPAAKTLCRTLIQHGQACLVVQE